MAHTRHSPQCGYVYYALEGLTAPDYQKYGFAYTNAAAAPDIPYNEIVVTVKSGARRATETMMTEIRGALNGTNIISREQQPSGRKIAGNMTTTRRIGTLFSIAFSSPPRLSPDNRQPNDGTLIACVGNLRSPGFSKREITARHALYGELITLPSMIAGWLISHFLLARFLYELGATYYTIDKNSVGAVSPHFFIASLCVALATSGATFFLCAKSLISAPAALMRPKPPAQGHRIFLERIALRRRLSFSGKIVARNLFRNMAR